MSSALPTPLVPQFQLHKAACTGVCLLGAWALLLAGSMAHAQSSTTDPSDPANTGVTITSGSTISFNNSSLTLTGAGANTGVTNLVLSGAGLTFGTVANTLTINGASNAVILTDPNSVAGGTLTGAIMTTTTGLVKMGAGGTLLLADPFILGSTLTLNGGSMGTATNVISGTLQVSSGLTFSSANAGSISYGYGTTMSLLQNNAYTGTLNVNATTLSTPASLVISGSTVGTMSSGALTLSSGGVLNLTNIINSGLNVTIGNTSVTGGLTLGTTGITLISGSTTVGGSSSSVTVTALGSLPAGNTPNSASFANPAVALIGIGNVGAQSISERGVIYSLSSANGTPALGGTGVVKVVHTGNPTASGSFSLTAAGLAASTSYTYRVYATDSTGATYLSAPSTFTTPTVLQNWRQTFFGTTQGIDHAADSADPDGDGVANLIEFATGKNPTSAQNTSATASASLNGGALEYTYYRSLDALNSGTTFTVEWNDTLNPSQWNSTGVSETVLSDNGLLQQVRATLPTSSTGRRFVRLNVLPPAQ